MRSENATKTALQMSTSAIDYDDPNVARADWGEAGIIMADPDFGSNEISISAKDALCNIMHALVRMGLDPEDVISAATESFEMDNIDDEIGGGERIAHDIERYPDPDKVPNL